MVRSLFLYRVFQLVLTIACTFSLTTILYACFLPCFSSCTNLGYNYTQAPTQTLTQAPSYTVRLATALTTYKLSLQPHSNHKKSDELNHRSLFSILPLVIPCDNGSPHLTHYLTFLHSPLTHYTCPQALIALCFDTTSYLTSNLMVTSTHAKTHHR